MTTYLNWTDVIVGTVVLAIVPFALAAYGGHLAAEVETEHKRKRRIQLTFWGVCLIGIVFTFYQQYKASLSDASKDRLNEDQKAKLDSLGVQNDSILKSLTPKEKTGDEAEVDRRQQIIFALRKKYILSHDVVPSKLVAGDGDPPAEWINGQLTAMNEKWSVSTQQPAPPVMAKALTHTHVEFFKTGFSSDLPRPYVDLGYRNIGSGTVLHASLRGDLKIAPYVYGNIEMADSVFKEFQKIAVFNPMGPLIGPGSDRIATFVLDSISQSDIEDFNAMKSALFIRAAVVWEDDTGIYETDDFEYVDARHKIWQTVAHYNSEVKLDSATQAKRFRR